MAYRDGEFYSPRQLLFGVRYFPAPGFIRQSRRWIDLNALLHFVALQLPSSHVTGNAICVGTHEEYSSIRTERYITFVDRLRT